MILIGILAIRLGLAAIVTATVPYPLAMRPAVRAAPTPRPTEVAPAGNGRRKGRAEAATTAVDERTLDRWLPLARRAFWLSAACALVASLALMGLTLGRHYEVKY